MPVRSAGTAAGTACRTRTEHFVRGDFAVTVFVECLQRGGSVGDFRRVELAIFVRVERRDDSRHGTPTAGTARTAAASAACVLCYCDDCAYTERSR